MKKTILEDGFPHAGKCLTDAQLPCTAKGVYESPVTTRTLVETEGGFCASERIEQDVEAKDITVDDYVSIENDITFE